MATKAKSKTKSKSKSKGVKLSLPKVSNRQLGTAAAVVAGVAAIGAGLFFAKDKSTPRPDFDTVSEEGEFSIRDYPALVVAETVAHGVVDRKEAQNDAFRTLSDYISGKSQDGEKIAMTAPILLDRDSSGPNEAWRMRFIMPVGKSADTLPPPPTGVTITELPARRVGAVAFSGLWTDDALESNESGLRQWLDAEGETLAGRVEYAFYDAPMIPGPLRRNEVLIALG